MADYGIPCPLADANERTWRRCYTAQREGPLFLGIPPAWLIVIGVKLEPEPAGLEGRSGDAGGVPKSKGLSLRDGRAGRLSLGSD